MLPRPSRWLAFAAFALLVPPAFVRGQGLIIDRRVHVPIARTFEVREVSVDARVRDQVAEVQVAQTFHNPGSFEIQAEYLFPLPEDGAVQNFVLMVDGRELPGRLMPKDEARRIFEEIVRTKRDPALLEYMGRGLLKTSVFPIPAGADRKVTMRYTLVCRRDRDVVEFSYPFGTQKFTTKPIGRLAVTTRIEGKDPIKSVYCPGADAEVRRDGDREATIKLVQRDVVPTADFRVVYTLAEGRLGASVLSYKPGDGEDGYFLLLASPDVKRPDERPRPKTVLFVLDRSGSMTGKKIEQARNALKFVLENLRDDDTFNIIAYDDRVESYKPEVQRYSSESRREAIRWVENIQPGGSTNIDDALTAALGMLRDDDRPNYVLFLTDGLPTAGETRESAIAEHVKKANPRRARVFSFGVGYDVNARLLDRISGGHGGTSEYVKPDEDIEAHVSRFYSKLTSPVLTDLRVEFDGPDANRTYPRDVPDLFEGGQLVLVGRYRGAGKGAVTLSGKVGSERQTVRFPAEFASTGEGRRHDFVEKLWAIRRVGFLIDQVDLHGQNKELTDELLSLSTKYGILTPYTSFLADERVNLHAFRENATRLHTELGRLSEVGGASGVGQRAAKGDYQNANQVDRFYQMAPAAPGLASVDAAGRPAATAANPASGPASAALAKRSAGRGMGGMGGGMAGMGGMSSMMSNMSMTGMVPNPAGAVIAKDAEGRDRAVATVRQVGHKTFFRRGDRWVDSAVKAEDEAKAAVVEQFSDDYFDLARKQSTEWNQYLTFEEPVVVELDGRVYRIERPRR